MSESRNAFSVYDYGLEAWLCAARGPSVSKKMRATRTLILTKASSQPTRFLALNINRKRFNQMAG